MLWILLLWLLWSVSNGCFDWACESAAYLLDFVNAAACAALYAKQTLLTQK